MIPQEGSLRKEKTWAGNDPSVTTMSDVVNAELRGLPGLSHGLFWIDQNQSRNVILLGPRLPEIGDSFNN